ncbi:MAG: L-rhamnose isomerase [Clostridia bacterium]|nr:L-rhamnose isomerase [Clostridia bacterium]
MSYESAKKKYASLGIDTDNAIDTLLSVPISIHCWQGDDVIGFDSREALSGGIQTTGNYPGRSRTPEELMSDIDVALSLIPGKKKLNLHASYAIIPEGESAGRDNLRPEHFAPWLKFAKERNMGIDFNPTFFAHPMVKDNLTLSSPDERVRRYWIDHGKACIRIAEHFAKETGVPCVLNFWIPDGYKETPADRYGPRARYAASMDEILTEPYDKEFVYITLESKVFGIGLESYTVGSAEFCLSYSATRGITPLMDNGHYHPTEVVSDKIPSLLLFNKNLALHVTRGVRWDSDHVVAFDDETREIAKEIVRCGALGRVFIALDYFDASINRVAAWIIGARNVNKALLYALVSPNEKLTELQNNSDFTTMFALSEEMKTMPFADVFDEYCRRAGVPSGMEWLCDVQKYEREVLSGRK